MKVLDWLKTAEKGLGNAGITTARLDSLVLLEDCLKKDRAWLLANPEHELATKQVDILKKLLNRRKAHEPLAYLRGKTEFYGREFVVNQYVLEPRPESETMIDCLLKLPLDTKRWRFADVGSGSGAIGITAALELKTSHLDLLEIDPKTIKVSKTNVDKFTLNISVIKSDLLSASSSGYDVLLCNLPYVPDHFHINLAAMHEPRLAIFGGQDGLDVYRRLFKQVGSVPKKPLYILSESLPPQHNELSKIAESYGYALTSVDDFIQVFTYSS